MSLKEVERIKNLAEDATYEGKQPREMFIQSILHFRKVICDNRSTKESREIAFESLTQDYLRCDLQEGDDVHYMAVADEFQRRELYHLFR